MSDLDNERELGLRALEWYSVYKQIKQLRELLGDKEMALRDSMVALNAERRTVPIPELDATVTVDFTDVVEWDEQKLYELEQIVGRMEFEKLLTKPKVRPLDKRKLPSLLKAGGRAGIIVTDAKSIKGKKLTIKGKDNNDA